MRLFTLFVALAVILIGCSKSKESSESSSNFPIEKTQGDSDLSLKRIPISTIILECSLDGSEFFKTEEEKFHENISVKVSSEYLIVEKQKILLYKIDVDGGNHISGFLASGENNKEYDSGKLIRISEDEFYATSGDEVGSYTDQMLSINRHTGIINYSNLPRKPNGIWTKANGRCAKIDSGRF